LHYHKIVENEYYVGGSTRSNCSSTLTLTRDILRNGSPLFLPPSEIATRSVRYSKYSLLSPLVSLLRSVIVAKADHCAQVRALPLSSSIMLCRGDRTQIYQYSSSGLGYSVR
jgi:hypothetical protein